MDTAKQQLLLEYLISSSDTFATCKGIVRSSYFVPELRKAVDFLHSYYDSYHTTPSIEQIKAETGIKLTSQLVTRDQIKYCSTEVETFCRRKAVESAILAAPKMISEGNYGNVEQLIKDAVSISLTRNLGLDYFNTTLDRLESQMGAPDRISTGYIDIDALMSGGIKRGELLLVSANSGGGKSLFLGNLALNFLAQSRDKTNNNKLNVLYISLELSEDLIGQRFDTMLTGISSVIWQQNYKEIAETVSEVSSMFGKLHVKRMSSGTTTNMIRGYLKEFELVNNYIPDLLVVDYMDCMSPNQQVSDDNISAKDKLISEQLHDLGEDYSMCVASASQQNRSAVTATELNHSHIAGGMSKLNAVDWYMSLIFTPAMKAAGQMGVQMLKARSSDGVGKTAYLDWDNSSLRLKTQLKHREDHTENALISKLRGLKSELNQPKKTLLDTFMVD
jgi:RecA/RadA recombinase